MTSTERNRKRRIRDFLNEDTHPGLRRTFVNLGNLVMEKKMLMMKKRKESKTSFRSIRFIRRISLIIILFCIYFFAISRLIPHAISFGGKSIPTVNADLEKELMRTSEKFWNICKKDPALIRNFCKGMTGEEFNTLRERLEISGIPFFEKASVTDLQGEGGSYQVDIPVNGGFFSLGISPENGAFAVSDFIGLNLN